MVAGGMGFFRRKLRGYWAGVQVEKHRASADDLRERDPQLYQQILATAADGSGAEAAARRDPDAYVALFLAESGEAGVIGGDKASAAEEPDPQRDRIYGDFLDRAGGLVAAKELVVDHLAEHCYEIDGELARELLDSWRTYGIVRNESLGDFLDDEVEAFEAVRSERVFAVVDLRRSRYHEGGDEIEVFADRGSAKRYLDDLRERDPKFAARLRIEERRSDASDEWDGRSSRLPSVSEGSSIKDDPTDDSAAGASTVGAAPPRIFEDGDLECASGPTTRALPGLRSYAGDAGGAFLIADDPENYLGTRWSYFVVDEHGPLLYVALPASADVQRLFDLVDSVTEWHDVPEQVERTLAATAAWLMS